MKTNLLIETVTDTRYQEMLAKFGGRKGAR